MGELSSARQTVYHAGYFGMVDREKSLVSFVMLLQVVEARLSVHHVLWVTSLVPRPHLPAWVRGYVGNLG